MEPNARNETICARKCPNQRHGNRLQYMSVVSRPKEARDMDKPFSRCVRSSKRRSVHEPMHARTMQSAVGGLLLSTAADIPKHRSQLAWYMCSWVQYHYHFLQRASSNFLSAAVGKKARQKCKTVGRHSYRMAFGTACGVQVLGTVATTFAVLISLALSVPAMTFFRGTTVAGGKTACNIAGFRT